MDRLGIVADIHGNAVALAAALDALARRGVDRVVCLGDVASGPRPVETLDRVRALGCPVVMGNADAAVLVPPHDPSADEDSRRWWDMERWCHERVGADRLAFVAGFAPAVTLEVGSRRVFACRGTPRSFDDALAPSASTGELDEALAGVGADVVLAGHTHRQMLRRHRGMVLVNPGSVGLPVDPLPPADGVRNPPWAEFAVLDAAGPDDLAVSFARVPYDLDRLRADVRASGVPHAEWFLADWRA